jgi:DNA mismatch repair protein MutH
MYDVNSASSIIRYAKKLKDTTLRNSCSPDIEQHNYKGKGNYGQLLEKFYFGYEPNSDSEPDFKEAKLELKSSPLKRLVNGEFRAKERLVLNIINYNTVFNEDFKTSSFWKKNAHLLLVFYLYESDLDLLDYVIKLVDDWKYPSDDLRVIKNDWEIINQKINDGKAHELSEGDTFYLAACTKGSTAEKSYREQPFSNEQAKQRAYSLKAGYVNHIIASISQEEDGIYGKIITRPKILDRYTIEEFIINKFRRYIGLSVNHLAGLFNIDIKSTAKNFNAVVSKALLKEILDIDRTKEIEEFNKAEIQVKTIRVEQNNRIRESISFPSFNYIQLYNEKWIESEMKALIEKKFLFIFFKNNGNDYVLDKVKFWNMPFSDRNEMRKVWLRTKKIIHTGEIIKEIVVNNNNDVTKYSNFPKKPENKVGHVRPHALNAADTYPLPVPEKTTGVEEYTKHCFWLNWDYVRDEIYLKD